MRKTCLVIVVAAALVGCRGKEKPTLKDPWGSFKIGSYRITKMTRTMGGDTANSSVSQFKETLKDLTNAKATVETEATADGKTTTSTRDIPLDSTPPPDGFRSGTEILSVAGKSLKCSWTEEFRTESKQSSAVKTWRSEEVPGFTVKMVGTTKGIIDIELVSEVTDFKAM